MFTARSPTRPRAISTARSWIMPPRSRVRPPDAGSKANQATAKVRLSLLSETLPPAPRTATAAPLSAASKAAPASPAGAASPSPPAATEQRKRAGDRQRDRQARCARDRQRRLCACQGAAQPHQRCARDGKKPARHRIRGDRRQRHRPHGDAERRSATSCAMPHGRRWQWSTTPVTACRLTAATIWCRSTSQFRAGSGMTDTMMDMDTIMAGLDDQVRTNILILDACRNNPVAPKPASAGSGRDIEAGAGLAAPGHARRRSTLGAGTLSPSRPHRTGRTRRRRRQQPVLGRAVAPHRHAGLEVQQMLTRVRAEVVAATEGKQVPWSIRRCSARSIWRGSEAQFH